MIEVDEILDTYRQRQEQARVRRDQQDEVSKVYNDEYLVDLPELDQAAQSAAANLTETGIDQWAQRIASPEPELDYTVDGQAGSKESRDRRLNRLHAMYGMWRQNNLKSRIRRPRARHLIGFAEAPVRMGWGDLKLHGYGPKWMLKDPRTVYPAPAVDIHDPLPENVIHAVTIPLTEAQKRWPAHLDNLKLQGPIGPDTILELISYDDADELVFVLMSSGRRTPGMPVQLAGFDQQYGPKPAATELYREPNRIGICPWTTPGRIGLDKPKGQFDGSAPLYRTMAELTALSLVATRKGVFQEEWLVGRDGRTPRVINPADSQTGEIGVVTGGDLINRTVDPQFQTAMMLDRLERSERARGGITADMTGEAASNVRTGRRASQLMSAQVDEGIQEAQETLAVALEHEVRMAQELDRAYSPARKTVNVGWKGARKPLTYSAAELWEGADPIVGYTFAGVSADGMEIKAGQRIAMQTMSRQRFMEIDTMIEDAELEKDRIVGEALNDAILQSIAALASSPEGPYQPAQIARIAMLVKTDRMELPEAIETVQKEAQEAQATAAPEGAPETMPGLSPPGQGVEQPAAIQGPNTLQENLGNVMARLRQPEMRVASER